MMKKHLNSLSNSKKIVAVLTLLLVIFALGYLVGFVVSDLVNRFF